MCILYVCESVSMRVNLGVHCMCMYCMCICECRVWMGCMCARVGVVSICVVQGHGCTCVYECE